MLHGSKLANRTLLNRFLFVVVAACVGSVKVFYSCGASVLGGILGVVFLGVTVYGCHYLFEPMPLGARKCSSRRFTASRSL